MDVRPPPFTRVLKNREMIFGPTPLTQSGPVHPLRDVSLCSLTRREEGTVCVCMWEVRGRNGKRDPISV